MNESDVCYLKYLDNVYTTHHPAVCTFTSLLYSVHSDLAIGCDFCTYVAYIMHAQCMYIMTLYACLWGY